MQDLNDKVTGNQLSAGEWNEIPTEIQNIITAYGITLSGADLNQLGKALSNKATTGDFFTDSGSANSYVLSSLPVNQDPTELREGMRIRWFTSNSNSGDSTINVTAFGDKECTKVYGGNSPLEGGEITGYNEAVYDGNRFFILDIEKSPDWIGASRTTDPVFGFATGSQDVAIATLNAYTIAIVDENSSNLQVYVNQGTTWSTLGNAFNLGSLQDAAIIALSSTRIAYTQEALTPLETYDFDGTNWTKTGNTFTLPSSTDTSITALTSTSIAILDEGDEELTVYSFDGTDWSQTGSALSVSAVDHPAIAAINSTTVAVTSASSGNLTTYEFNGSTWSSVGNSLTIPTTSNIVMCAMNMQDVVISDDSNFMTIYRWNGTDWSQQGYSANIGSVTKAAIAPLNGRDIAWLDTTGNELRVYRLATDTGRLPFNRIITA